MADSLNEGASGQRTTRRAGPRPLNAEAATHFCARLCTSQRQCRFLAAITSRRKVRSPGKAGSLGYAGPDTTMLRAHMTPDRFGVVHQRGRTIVGFRSSERRPSKRNVLFQFEGNVSNLDPPELVLPPAGYLLNDCVPPLLTLNSSHIPLPHVGDNRAH